MDNDSYRFEPKSVNFLELFKHRYFIIPAYQRHFAWTEKECEELFQDIVITARSANRKRFMSAITTIRPSDEIVYPIYKSASHQELEPFIVVDGQQRLTSLLILVSCLCRNLKGTLNSEDADRIYDTFVFTELDMGIPQLRLLPQEIPDHPGVMRDTFLAITSLRSSKEFSKILIPAQRRLENARELFDDGIENLEFGVTVRDMIDCIQSRLIFVLNVLTNVGQAGEVFEGINNRGLGLNILESLKSYSIYAIQSFKDGNTLPNGVDCSSNANLLIDRFNSAIGQIYFHLDRVGLKDREGAALIQAVWPILLTRIQEAGLQEKGFEIPLYLSDKLITDVRRSLHIESARSEKQKSDLLNVLNYTLTECLTDASRYFADARCPKSSFSFEDLKLTESKIKELRGLHQRLVDMRSTVPFLSLLIAYRLKRPDDAEGYLKLARLVERVAFWVYTLRVGNAGYGKRTLVIFAREFTDGKINASELFQKMVDFGFRAFSKTAPGVEFSKLLSHLLENASSTTRNSNLEPTLAYEWLFNHQIELPSFNKFLKLHFGGMFLEIAPTLTIIGKSPRGYSSDVRVAMRHAGNIVITSKTPTEMSNEDIASYAKMAYSDKKRYLKTFGYSLPLPNEITREWAEKLGAKIRKFAASRWRIPNDGQIDEETWRDGGRDVALDSDDADPDDSDFEDADDRLVVN
jgi:hypothetical protein